ncbi:WD40-repeat-containing domain protein [Fimicolochytrium jonesii]|uniref:WD40-repeat-containing domain protein n=1 Tax=Fimicolochytrium jonesii TaxID=1396493 RepID=UPI0022FDE96C|nr:WD40-repeat-containing domain protein [Fimicolochytrium jonesii]KAI8824388.1 WD40-repeat-containing domain protein [Fimicolochytrium jonesii]
MTLEKSQIITHIQKSLPFTAYDVRWVPSSARFVVLGQHPRGTGALQVYELSGADIKLIKETEKQDAFKCGTFGASSLQSRHLATGDFGGRLSLWDLEKTDTPLYSVKAHEQIINCIDGAGGVGSPQGPPEIATGSRDGSVKIWDTRQKDKPVAKIAPAEGEVVHDTWAVAFGNSYNDQERVVCAGYENGDVKMFDLRQMSLLWETNVKNGVCSVEFDRKDIQMNKLVVTTLESNFRVYDVRTQHPKNGFAHVNQKAHDATTVWTARHLPQNRDIFMTSGGNGSLELFKYNYPDQRTKKDSKNVLEGVAGTLELINSAHAAEQPIAAFDWSPDKKGLCVYAAFDQAVRVGIVTKLDQY